MKYSVYEDNRGWRYKVRSGIGGKVFKASYSKDGKGWHGVKSPKLVYVEDKDKAQIALDEYADKKGYKCIGEIDDLEDGKWW